jgi:hypothetical protein
MKLITTKEKTPEVGDKLISKYYFQKGSSVSKESVEYDTLTVTKAYKRKKDGQGNILFTATAPRMLNSSSYYSADGTHVHYPDEWKNELQEETQDAAPDDNE